MIATPKSSNVKNTAVIGGVDAIPSCEQTAPTRQTVRTGKQIDRGPVDIVFAGGVSIALWAAIIFVFTVVF